MLTIIIADDHAIFREGLVGLLDGEAGVEIAGQAANGAELLDLVEKTKPAVAVVDVTMPGHDMPEFLAQCRRVSPETRVIALTQHAEPHVAGPIVQAGVAGYVVKESAFEELLVAVRAVAEGQNYVSPHVASALLKQEDEEPLTPRELQVVKLIAAGLGNKQIARRLHISTDTVRTHRNRIMQKLDLHSAAELTRYAIEHGMA